jgi:chromosomal replication initiator protein|tara:strand:- start:752 stop:1120 length:369 start_codon:yes stop_codon:yes gene_type:complete
MGLEALPKDEALPVQTIVDLVAADFGVSTANILDDSRRQTYVVPRQYCVWLAFKLTAYSFPTLGKIFNRHHTTILHSIRTVDTRRINNNGWRMRSERLLTTLEPVIPKRTHTPKCPHCGERL